MSAAGVLENSEIYYTTNEVELGDCGVGGLVFTQRGFQTTSRLWTEFLFRARDIHAILGAHISRIEAGVIFYEQIDGNEGTLNFDFAMLLPHFKISSH